MSPSVYHPAWGGLIRSSGRVTGKGFNPSGTRAQPTGWGGAGFLLKTPSCCRVVFLEPSSCKQSSVTRSGGFVRVSRAVLGAWTSVWRTHRFQSWWVPSLRYFFRWTKHRARSQQSVILGLMMYGARSAISHCRADFQKCRACARLTGAHGRCW